MTEDDELPTVQVHVVIPGWVGRELDKRLKDAGRINRSDLIREILIQDVRRHGGIKRGA
jgi:metal-responsive CopG/Arc/MetJ family transcriptional regulator